MAKVKPKTMSFPPSPSADVVSYKLYVVPTGQPLDYDSPFEDIGVPPDLNADGKLDVDLGGLNIAQTIDGVYDMGLVAVDDVGNESAMSIATGVSLDFIAPDAPGPLEFA